MSSIPLGRFNYSSFQPPNCQCRITLALTGTEQREGTAAKRRRPVLRVVGQHALSLSFSGFAARDDEEGCAAKVCASLARAF